mmetsp:Transcript_17395/g.26326  ORF Transcript_17395/g.26326 Transcript_17395/m.26326 type:complete len:197 (-) Transcript_17395:175-765(-)
MRSVGPWTFLTALVVMVGAIFLAINPQVSTMSLDTPDSRKELLLGYKMLGNHLENGSKMQDLILLRKGIFRAPSDELERLMLLIAETSRRLKTELKSLRELEPTLNDTPPSLKLLDKIEQISIKAGQSAMLFPQGTFDMRFVGLQYLATQMLSSTALSTSSLDPNKERRVWLENVSKEFSNIREQLISSVKTCNVM